MKANLRAKVISEKYQISYKVKTDDGYKRVTKDVEYKDAYWDAFLVAGTHRCSVIIQRITTVETPDEAKDFPFAFLDGMGGDTVDLVTGGVTIEAGHFATDSALSRYHPVNGWVIPEYVSFDDPVIA